METHVLLQQQLVLHAQIQQLVTLVKLLHKEQFVIVQMVYSLVNVHIYNIMIAPQINV